MDIILYIGNFGCGKTMFAVEAAKIKLARYLEQKIKVQLYALTYTATAMDYTLLNEEFKSKWFQNVQDKNQVKVYHWNEFLCQFIEENKKIMNLSQENLLKKKSDSYHIEGNDLKSVLKTIGEILNQSEKKTIIMIDELSITKAFKETKSPGTIRSFKVDFLYLKQYKNVHFIICIRSRAYPGSLKDGTFGDFELILPDAEQHGGLIYCNIQICQILIANK